MQTEANRKENEGKIKRERERQLDRKREGDREKEKNGPTCTQKRDKNFCNLM